MSTLRILIVEDCPEDREFYRRLLLETGGESYVFEEAATGEEGLRLCRSHPCDCVLLDHMLPDLTGVEFLGRLASGALPPAVVMITGQDDASVAVRAMKAGAQDYLVKGSITREGLERAVHTAVDKARLLGQIERQRAELERRNKELEDFVQVASHDLQEPLRKVVSFGDLLARNLGERLDPKSSQYLRFMQQSTLGLQRLIQDLLAMSRAERAPLRVAPTAIERCVSEALELLSAGVEETGASVEIDPLPTLQVDPAQFRQLYQNLLSNALKFRGEAPPHIRITCEPGPDGLVLGVADQGIGIELEYQEKIFQAFQRLHSREKYEGNGIGLALCRRIVERHGGRIWVESNLGQGAHFRFVLPAAGESQTT